VDVDVCAVPFAGGGCVRPDVFDIDLYEVDGETPNSRATAAIHAIGARAICYIDAGSIETYRPDHGRFVAFDERCGGCLIGNPFSKVFSDENWANISNDHGQRDFMLRMMERRVRLCADAGFDAVEFDVVDAYAQGASVTGWRIDASAQLVYNRALAKMAHSHGLSVGLKNDLGQIPVLLPYFDFAINEQCFQYDECDPLRMFVEAGKPVFQVEYRISLASFCPPAGAMSFSSIKKARDFSLFAEPWVPCR
jgi:hypothetical protein